MKVRNLLKLWYNDFIFKMMCLCIKCKYNVKYNYLALLIYIRHNIQSLTTIRNVSNILLLTLMEIPIWFNTNVQYSRVPIKNNL